MSKQRYEEKMNHALNLYNKHRSAFHKNQKHKLNLENKYRHASSAERKAIKNKISSVNRANKSEKHIIEHYANYYRKCKKHVEEYIKRENRRKKTLANKTKTLNHAKIDKPGYWKTQRPLIMPKYPGTDHSYVYIDNNSESESSSTSLTANSISPGQYVNHFTQMEPTQHQIEGKLGGTLLSMDPVSGISGLKKQYDMLRRWSENGIEVEILHGQRPTQSAVLTAVSANFDAPRDNAISVSVSYEEVKWAKSAATKSSKKGSPGKKPAKKSTSNHRKKGNRSKNGRVPTYTVIKKGDSYWMFHKKYGTTISDMESWNGWHAKHLPIGKKIRVR